MTPIVLLHLANVQCTLGHHADAVATCDRVLATDPANVIALNCRGLALQALGRDAEAADDFRRALAARPDAPETQFNLANALHRQGRHAEAAEHYRRCLAAWPNFARAHAGLGSALFQLKRWQEALPSLREAARLNLEGAPGDIARLHETIGDTLCRLQREEESLASFDRALELDPGNTRMMTGKASALAVIGRIDEARSLIEQAISLRPDEASLYVALHRTKRFTASDPAIAAMEQLLESGQLLEEQTIGLHFALGKAYDDIGDAARAFPHFARGNALRRRQIHYDEERELSGKAAIADFFTPALMQSKAGHGHESDRPIFIVGMPRSGTTLIERIIASHPLVFGAGEQHAFQDALDALVCPGQPGFPDMVPPMSGAEIKKLGADYIARMSELVPNGQRFTDKLPANYYFAGLIHLALPNAKIVHVRRNPVDTCLSVRFRRRSAVCL